MKKIHIFAFSGMLLLLAVFFAPIITRADTNLIANPSFETVDGSNSNLPQNWLEGNWGTNTATFSYLNTGHTGSRSGEIQITSYTSGDAKWYFTPVAVQPNTQYTFSDYYQSTVPTEIVAQIDDGSGNLSYQDLGSTVPSSSTWIQTSVNFTTPANAKIITIFHLINSVGTLTVDDFSLTASGVVTPPPPPPPSTTIANPGVETADPSNPAIPQYWQNDSWGTNTATFSYLNTGHTGSHSVETKITSYTSGAAEWFFDPISVTPGTKYTFGDYYQSTIASEVDVVYTMSNGATKYVYLGSPAASSAWNLFQANFTAPAGAQSATVYHLISSAGTLTTDDYFLNTASAVTSYVPNNSMEIPSPADPTNLPDQWFHSGWGTNTPVYTYANDGYDGSRSVELTMTNYVSGDAKWDYTPQVLPVGDYKFTAWYKTDTIPHVVVQYVLNNGTDSYYGLSDPEPVGTDWQQYSGVFPVAKNVKSLSVFFFLTNNGTVQTDDYQITPYQYVGFSRPIVTLTFDNGFEDNVTTALPTLDKYGFKVTYCYSTEYVEGQPAIQATDVLKIANDGNETCSHSVHHSDMTLESVPTMDYELSHSQSYLETLTGQPVTDFLSPFGLYNLTLIQEIKKYYNAHRTTDQGYNSKDNLNPYKLLVQNMDPTTTLAQFEGWVNKAKSENLWLILVYHQIYAPGVPVALQSFDTYKADFVNQMKWLSTAGVTVEPMNKALPELEAQE